MQVTFKQSLIVAGVFLAVLLAVAVAFTLSKQGYEKQIVQLQNEVAVRDKTLEVKEGVYQKLVIQSNDLSSLLNNKDGEIQRLNDQLSKQGSQILTANTLIVQLKKDLQSSSHVVVQPTDPKYPGMIHAKLDSKNDFDPFLVTGDVLTDCSVEQSQSTKATLKLSQTRPLKLSVVVSQDKDGTWRSSTTSSADNFQIDIALAGVNPYLLEEKWYEKFSFSMEAGVGTNPGLLFGGGINYEIGKFEVGPRVWGVLDHGASPYFGATLSWHPFKK